MLGSVTIENGYLQKEESITKMHHYKIHKPEPIDLILKYNLNFIEGNIVKYILRSPFKGDSRGDLHKALYYARMLKPKPNFRRIFDDSLQEYTELSPWLLQAIKSTIESNLPTTNIDFNFTQCKSTGMLDWKVVSGSVSV